jgi:DNA polymerase-1
MICWWKDDPSRDEALKCYDRLQRELRELQPKLIITLGGLVTEFFTGRKLFESRGAVIWNKEYKSFVMPTNHPAAILHVDDEGDKAANTAMDLWRDFSKIPDILQMPRNDDSEHAIYTIVTKPEEARYVLEHLPRMNADGTGVPVALDVETDSRDIDEIDVIDDRLQCFGISTPTRGETWVFTPESWDGLTPVFEALKDNVRWTFWNGPFDTEVMRGSFGVWLKIVEDAMMQSYSLDERPGYHKLKPNGREYNAGGWWEEERKKAGVRLHELDRDKLYRYNAGDCWNTAVIQPKFERRQKADGVWEMYRNLLIPAVNTFNRVQYRGVKVDRLTLGRFVVMWGQELVDLEAEVKAMANHYGWLGELNLDSPTQMCKFFYEILCLPAPPHAGKNKSGRTSDKKALDFWAGTHPFPTKMKEFRELAKAFDVYVVGGDRHMKYDGRAHPKIQMHGTVSGRPTYKDPPLNTIPRPFSENAKFAQLRTLYTASDKNRVVIEADYSKAEVWMAYYYSRDQQIYNDLCSGDYHRMVASTVYKRPPEEISDWQRSETKKIVFGTMYGMEEGSMAERTNSTREAARGFLNAYFERNAGYTAWTKEIHRLIEEEGEIVTLTGRKRRFIMMGSKADYRAYKQAVNFPIQSTSSDVTLVSAIELHPLLEALDAYIMITVYDSIVVDAPIENLAQVLDTLHRVMTASKFSPHNIYVPIEIKIGRNWGAAKGVHDCEKAGCLAARRDGVEFVPDFTDVAATLRDRQLVAA